MPPRKLITIFLMPVLVPEPQTWAWSCHSPLLGLLAVRSSILTHKSLSSLPLSPIQTSS